MKSHQITPPTSFNHSIIDSSIHSTQTLKYTNTQTDKSILQPPYYFLSLLSSCSPLIQNRSSSNTLNEFKSHTLYPKNENQVNMPDP